MISRRVKIQLVVFVILSAVGIVYTGLNYVGFKVLQRPYTVTAYFKDSGGIFPNANVTDRGVSVGQVGDMHLTKQGDIAVQLHIQHGHKIPADSRAIVANLSAVGEQYVDIQPQTDSGPYLKNGDSIPVSRTQVPLGDAILLKNLDDLVNSVDRQHLATTIEQLGAAFRDTGPALQQLIDKGDKLTQAAQNALPQTVKLINDSKTVLDTQRAVAGDLKTFAANLNGLSAQIVRSDPDIRHLMDNGVRGSAELTSLLNANRTALPILLGNMVTLGRIQVARLPGLQSVLVLYPANVANGFLGAAGGIAHFGLVYNSSPPPCTEGYGATPHRSNNQKGTRPQDWGGPANLNTYCTQPPQGPSDVRGARNAPRPAGDNTATGPYQPGGGTSASGASRSPAPASARPPAASSSGPAAVTTYDPLSGLLLGPDGHLYQMGETGGQQDVLGNAAWEWLLLGPAAG